MRSKEGMGEGTWEGVEFRLQFGPEQGRSEGDDQGVSAGRVEDDESGPSISSMRREPSR
jgi:hypothetical protein